MPSFGEDLRRERELRKISLREIAESTKINVRYLDALENNDFKRLPGGVFNKGFVRAYAQHIGVDEEDMVNAYLLEEQAQCGASPREGEPLRGRHADRLPSEAQPDRGRQLSTGGRRLGAVLGILAVAAAIVVAGVLLWPRQDAEGLPEGAVESPRTEPATVNEGIPEQEADPLPAPEEKDDGQEPAGEPAGKPLAVPITEPAEEPAEEPATAVSQEVEILLARPTGGRLNCDNRRVELLDGLAAGTVFRFQCDRFLIVDADDGGALTVTVGGTGPAPLAGDGVPVEGKNVLPARETR